MRILSLRKRLFLLIIIPLIVVAGIAAVVRFVMAEQLARTIYDNTLLTVALTISRDVVMNEGDILAEQLLDSLTKALGDPVYYQVSGPGGRFFTGYSDPPPVPPGVEVGGGQPVFYDSVTDERLVRAVVLREFLAEPRFGGWVTVKVWQTVRQREALTRSLLAQSLTLMALLIATAALLVSVAISRGLRPLDDLREAVNRRSPDDLSPIRRPVPTEVRSLVAAMNSLFSRLTEAFALRERFISDAAHQLRNPVAAIQAQAEAATTAPDEASLRARVEVLATTARQTGRLTQQLLSIERIRGRSLLAKSDPVDLEALVKTVAGRHFERSVRRDIGIALDVRGAPRPIRGDDLLLEEALENLIDNAVVHGSSPGDEVLVVMDFRDQAAFITVCDQGPGIPAEDAPRIFERFYRSSVTASRGCGLGLAIAREAAEAHGGDLTLAPSTRGTCFQLRLPYPDPA